MSHTRTGKILPFLRLRRPLARSSSREIVGLVTIAEACKTTPDKLVDWWLHHKFPMTYRGWKWMTTNCKINRWLLSLPKRYPRQECRG